MDKINSSSTTRTPLKTRFNNKNATENEVHSGDTSRTHIHN
jgi:hypothetical protein